MNYSDLVFYYERIAKTTKRLEKTSIIAELLKKTSDEDLEAVILLLKGMVFADWEETKIGVSHNYVIKALSKTSGMTEDKIKDEWKKIGDLGEVTEKLMHNKGQATLFSKKLTVREVLKDIQKLATEEGSGSVERKIGIMSNLLSNSNAMEAKYLVRMILEDLRVGVSDGTLRDSIVWAYLYDASQGIKDRDEYNEIVKITDSAYHKTNDFTEVALMAKKGLSTLKKVSLKHGKPIKVMLAQKEKSVKEAFKKVGRPAILEYKLDGFRMQVHKEGDKIKLFTRRLDEVTTQFPDVVEAINKGISAKSCVLDSEVVGYDVKNEKYLVFQNISQRIRRKHNIQEMVKKLPVEINFFDIISLEGENVMSKPIKERIELLNSIVRPIHRRLRIVERKISGDDKEAEEFYSASVDAGNEGLMFKKIDSVYQPGSRVGTMVKLKAVKDPMDLVVIGGEWGTGKRSGWITSLILGCYDPDEDEYLEIGRVGTGLKEKEEEGLTFEEVTEQLKDSIIKEKGREVKISPKIVLEIEYEEIQKSPSYSSGFALRFPRVKLLRYDRTPEDATTISRIEQLFREQ